MLGHILAVANPKGGVGKSTAALNISAVSAKRGRKTLLIDLDPQGSASILSGIDGVTDACSAGAMFRDDPVLVSRLAQPTRYGFDIVPAGPSLITAEDWLMRSIMGEQRLRLLFNKDAALEQYDLIVVDTAGFKGRLLNSTLLASSDVLIPLRPSVLSTNELPDFFGLLDQISELRQAMGDTRLSVAGLLFNMVREGTNAALANIKEVQEALQVTKLPYPILSVVIPEATVVEEAGIMRAPVVSVRPSSKVAVRYGDVYSLVVEGVDPARGELAIA